MAAYWSRLAIVHTSLNPSHSHFGMKEPSSASLWAGGIIVALIIIGLLYVGMARPDSQESVSAEAGGTTGEEEIQDSSTATGVSGGSAQGGRKPLAVTTSFASVSSTTAVVVGTVDPEGLPTRYWFEYGTSLTFDRFAEARSIGGGTSEIGASGYLTALKPNTEYYFRIAAENAKGRVYGSAFKFITAPK